MFFSQVSMCWVFSADKFKCCDIFGWLLTTWVSEWAGFYIPINTLCHYRDESSKSITCTGTDNLLEQPRDRTQINTIQKVDLALNTLKRNPGLVAFYDIQPGNRAVLFFQPRSHNAPGCQSLHGACWSANCIVSYHIWYHIKHVVDIQQHTYSNCTYLSYLVPLITSRMSLNQTFVCYLFSVSWALKAARKDNILLNSLMVSPNI